MRKPVIALIAVVVLAVGVSWIIVDRTRGDRSANAAGPAGPSQVTESAPAEGQGPSTPEPEREASGKGLVAIEQAANADRYLLVFFFAQSDAATQEKQEVFNAAVEAVADKADSVAVDVTDPLERGIVNKFRAGFIYFPGLYAVPKI